MAFSGLALAIAVVPTVALEQRIASAAGVATVTAALCATLNAVNQMLTNPLLSDAAGLITGAVLTAIAALVWASIGERRTTIGRNGLPERDQHDERRRQPPR